MRDVQPHPSSEKRTFRVRHLHNSHVAKHFPCVKRRRRLLTGRTERPVDPNVVAHVPLNQQSNTMSVT
ncbi:hypothetical protein BDR07DRAFT_867232 [Suillus spraguei]|nr:hypothetical protein BDR07DRAFT_867232 [Suillus spraguei]